MSWAKLLIPFFKIVYLLIKKTGDVKSKMVTSIPSSDKEIAIKYIFQYVGQWYKWGGDRPDGFDCSGLAIEYLKASGKVERKFDTTADGLWKMFAKQRVDKPSRGCLVFWKSKTSEKIIHVEIMLNESMAIGASGGGSKTVTPEDAMRDNAFIKVRVANTRPAIAGYVDPYLKG